MRPTPGARPQPGPPTAVPGVEPGVGHEPEPSHSAPARPAAAPRPRVADPRVSVSGSSRLSERAIEEYHYVGRDLRNISVLVVVMVVLLAAAAVAVNLLGITQP